MRQVILNSVTAPVKMFFKYRRPYAVRFLSIRVDRLVAIAFYSTFQPSFTLTNFPRIVKPAAL
jgi:hypothetical protein